MWAQAKVAEQIYKLTNSDHQLDPMVEQCVEVRDPKELALCLVHLPDDELLDGLRRSLRDLFVVQVASGQSKERFVELLKAHFGKNLTGKLQSQMCLAHHHVFVGKFTKSAHPRARRQRHVALLLRTVSSSLSAELTVDRNLTLRDCQEELCKLFKKSFPKFKACLVIQGPRGPRVYNDFMDHPFRKCTPSDEATVVFEQTDDPYFYDLRDRRGKKPVSDSVVERGMPLLHI